MFLRNTQIDHKFIINDKRIISGVKDKPVKNSIQFTLQNFCFKSIKEKNFTNFLKDNMQFTEKIGVFFHEFFEYFEGMDINKIFTSSSTHSHLLTKNQDSLCKNILKEYVESGHKFKNLLIDESEYYQLGFKSGLRVVGKRYGSKFELLFLDFHHLLDSDEKYNQGDFKKYKLCMLNLKDEKLEMEDYEKLWENNRELQQYKELFECDICLECDTLNNKLKK